MQRALRTVIYVILLSAITGPAATAQRESTIGLCHVDPDSGTVEYVEVSSADAEIHQRHGDTFAPNGPADCRATLPPVAVDDEYTAEPGITLVVPAPGVLANDQGAATARLVRDPAHGVLELGSDGSFTYTADRDHPGTDVFAYEASNEYGEIDAGEVFIYLPAGVNSPPVAIDDYYLLQGAAPFFVPAPGVLANDYDPDNDPVSLVGFATGAKGGTAPQSSPDGGFTFIPVSGVNGQYPFTTIISDGLETAQSTAILDVQLDPASPVAQIDVYTAPASGPFSVDAVSGVLANDASPVGSGLSATLYQGYPTAAIAINADGSFTVTIPGGATSGTHMGFWYQVTDGQGRAVLQQVSITFQ